MGLIQSFNCMRGKHQRSRGHVWHDGDTFHSRCRGCGKPMVRTNKGWILETGAPAEELTGA